MRVPSSSALTASKKNKLVGTACRAPTAGCDWDRHGHGVPCLYRRMRYEPSWARHAVPLPAGCDWDHHGHGMPCPYLPDAIGTIMGTACRAPTCRMRFEPSWARHAVPLPEPRSYPLSPITYSLCRWPYYAILFI